MKVWQARLTAELVMLVAPTAIVLVLWECLCDTVGLSLAKHSAAVCTMEYSLSLVLVSGQNGAPDL